jgi:hypothetical protein
MGLMKKKRFRFTLLEAVIAVAILGMSLTVLFQLLFSARKRINHTLDDWNNTHRIIEAAEYVLLHNDKTESIPSMFFPYDDCRIYIDWQDISDIHDEYDGSLDGQPELKTCHISLVRTSDGETLETLAIDRIVLENGLTENEN